MGDANALAQHPELDFQGLVLRRGQGGGPGWLVAGIAAGGKAAGGAPKSHGQRTSVRLRCLTTLGGRVRIRLCYARLEHLSYSFLSYSFEAFDGRARCISPLVTIPFRRVRILC